MISIIEPFTKSQRSISGRDQKRHTKIRSIDAASYVYCKEPESNFIYSINDMDVNFTELSLGAQTYNWQFGDGNTSSQAAPSHTYAAAGSYNATLTVTDAHGCSSSDVSVIISSNKE